MAEQRKGYSIYVSTVRDRLPRLQVFDCVITPKRVAVFEEGRTRDGSYYRPDQLDETFWTPEGAWEQFRKDQEARLQSAQEKVEEARRLLAFDEGRNR